MHITHIKSRDARFELKAGAGSDAIHSTPQYSFAVTSITTDQGVQGTGLVLTMGTGNELVCEAIQHLGSALVGSSLDDLMVDFGARFRQLADHPQLRWLGPHKGVVHLALASITNACFDLWAKAESKPLWKLLLDLPPESLVALLDLSYLEDVLDAETALAILREQQPSRDERMRILGEGYPGYDTSVGWFNYDDAQIRENVARGLDRGFGAFKLKVGGALDRDLRRAFALREQVGPTVEIMLDANQQWSLPSAVKACSELKQMRPLWIEEPTHPDDIEAHRKLAAAVPSVALALGEHVPNRVMFKNFLEAGCVKFLQPDCTRLGGVSEFLTVSLLARKYNVPIVPHVGDMGQIHQHLVLVTHIAMGHPVILLEHIPHLREHFVHPADVAGGHYRTPQEPGSSSDLL